MSCNRFQLDLSRCLDGRLPGARRTEVMAHVDRCAECEQVWADMQAAQSLVFGLEQPQVRADFREHVWSRIRSGEGAPEVLLSEPIQIWSKVRYGLIGAAAAAVFLFTLNQITSSGTPVDDNTKNVVELNENDDKKNDNATKPGPGPEVAKIDTTRRDQPSTNPFGNPTLVASQLAHVTAEKVTTAAKELRRHRGGILSNQLDQPTRRQVIHYVRTIDDGLQVLGHLERRKFVEFADKSRDCVISVRNSLNLSRDPVKKTYNLVRTLTDCNLDGLDRQLRYTISVPQIEQQAQMLYGMLADEHFRRILTDHLNVIQQQGPMWLVPMANVWVPVQPQMHLLVPIPSGAPQPHPHQARPAQPEKEPKKELRKRSDRQPGK